MPLPAPAPPQTDQDDWEKVATSAAPATPASGPIDLTKLGTDDWEKPTSGAGGSWDDKHAIVQTHPGGPTIDLEHPPTGGPVDIRDIAAIGKYHLTHTPPEQLQQESHQSTLNAINQVPTLAGIAAGFLGSPEADPVVAMTTKSLMWWALRQAGWDALTAGGTAAGLEAGRHAVARSATPELEPPRTWGDIALKPAETGAGAAALTFGTGAILHGSAAAIAKASLPTVSKATDLIFGALKSSNPGFRENLMVATDDLARMAKADKAAGSGIFHPGAAGGMLEPDMRSRALLDSFDKYLDQKYATQVGQQMSIATRMGTTVDLGSVHPADLQLALNAIHSGSLPSAEANRVVQNMIQHPGAPIPIEDANILREQVNQMLLSFESKTASAQNTSLLTNKRVAALKELDQAIKSNTNASLQRIGQPGLSEYERQYAGLADLRNELAKGMNTAERDRLKISAIPVVRPSGVGVKFTPYNFMSRQGRDLQKAMELLANDPHLGTQPLWHANAGGAGPAGALGPAPGLANPNVPMGPPAARTPGGALPQGPVPPGPPGPPATGPHFTPGPPPPWSAYAAPAGPQAPGNIAMTGVQEPIPHTPSVPAPVQQVPPEPLGRLTSPFGPRRVVSGPAPEPTTQPTLGAPSFPAGPKSEPAYSGPERRLETNAPRREIYNQWNHASGQIAQIQQQLADPTYASIHPHLQQELQKWQAAAIKAEDWLDWMDSHGDIPGTKLEGAGAASQAHPVAQHIQDALREAGLPITAHIGTKAGVTEIDTGYQVKPFVEGGKPGPVTITFSPNEQVTAASIKKKIAEKLSAFGDRIINR